MKKKVLTVISIAILSILVAACGSKKTGTGDFSIGFNPSTDTKEESVSADGTPLEDNQNVTDEKQTDSEEFWLYSGFYNSLYKISENEITEKVDLEELLEYGTFLDLYGRNVIAYSYERDEASDEYGTRYYITNIDTKEKKNIAFFSTPYHYAAIWGDKFIEVVRDNNEYFEKVYDLNSLEEVPASNDLYLSGENTILVNYNPLDYAHTVPAGKILEDNGAVLWNIDQNLVYVDADGQRKEYANPLAEATIEAYRNNKIVASRNGESYYKRILSVFDIDTNNEEVICEKTNSIIGVYGDLLVYSVVDSSEYGKDSRTYKSYNLATGEGKDLFSCKPNLGVDDYIPGSDINYANDKLYYLYDDGNETDWFIYDLKNESVNKIKTPIKEYDYFKLGSISLACEKASCNLCGNDPGLFRVEYFVFDNDAFLGAGAINDFFEKDRAERINNFREEAQLVLEELTCDDHEFDYAVYSVEKDINDVFVLNDKYAVVNTDGYVYMGGAHGMPTKDSLIFSCESGEKMNFFDIYSGSFDEFRDYVATRAKEDFESYPEGYSPYFSSTAEAVYNDAYEYLDKDYLPVIWERDGLTVSYAPYLMGPFAAGFIEYKFSYEELGISFE